MLTLECRQLPGSDKITSMNTSPNIRFSAIGLNHGHIYAQVNLLMRAGAELASFFAQEPDLTAQFRQTFPQARQARSMNEILEDESVQMIVTAAIPCERAPLGISAMQHGKDVMTDKPAFTTLDQLESARRVQAETGRIYSVCYSERLENRATVKAGELVRSGAIGKVAQTIGTGPHRINLPSRPGWFFEREKYGGIICDIGAHQADQFLFFTNSTSFEIVASTVANYKYPQYPGLEDFGEALVRGTESTGFFRVDWYTPDGLDVWGDASLFVLGTEGYIEVRKYTDISGKPGGDHLFLVDHQGMHSIDCSQVELTYGKQLISDVLNRTETAMPQAHCFLASELALRAELQAKRLGNLIPD
jgi:predicted dehydrogenase